MKNIKGQVSTEMLLMIVLFVGVAILVSTTARNSEWFANLVSGPWQSLASTIQNGVPGTTQSTAQQHPNNYSRWATVRGDDLK